MVNLRSQTAFSLAELVVAIAISGIIILLSTKVYLLFIPQFRNSHEVSESQFKALLKVSSIEKRIVRELASRDSTGIVDLYTWLGNSPDSLDITWTLNQYLRDSIYSINQNLLAKYFEGLETIERDHLYLKSLAIDLYADRNMSYYIFSDHPNLHRVKVEELFNETH